MCGEHSIDAAVRFEAEGSSPHVRGAPNCAIIGGSFEGIIPACAGSTWGIGRELYTAPGSSPHVRGAR